MAKLLNTEVLEKAKLLRAKGATREQWEYATMLGEACDSLKQCEEENKILTEDFEGMVGNYKTYAKLNEDYQAKIEQQQAELDKESIEHLQIQQETEKAFTKQLDQQQKCIRKIIGYSKHSPSCLSNAVIRVSCKEINCNCGYSKTIAEADKLLKPETPKERPK